MKNFKKIAGLAGVLALSASPAMAVSGHAPSNQGTAHAGQGTTSTVATPGPGASAQSKGKAYGKFCATQSRVHVEGTPGTPFSLCVTALAKVGHNHVSPAKACKTESKKHVAGTPGTPFSKCVSAAAKLRKAQLPDTTETPGADVGDDAAAPATAPATS